MRILIIGGTGLISTAITRQLLEAGYHVTLFNRGVSENRLPYGAKNMNGNRRDYPAFEEIFSDKTFDVVVDMIAFTPEDSASAVRAFSGRVGQFIHCSTVCVYSGPTVQVPSPSIPIPETEPFHSAPSCTYGQNKILCERLLQQESEQNKFPVTIMRPSHSYGEGGGIHRGFGPSTGFVDRMRQGKPIIVFGDGSSLWAACHVEDVARGFIGVMGNSKCLSEAYHITGDEWMTWNTYYDQVAQAVDGKFEPIYIPTNILAQIAPQWGDGTRDIFSWPSIFDNSKIKRDTNYTGQTIRWLEGVRRNIEWHEASKSRIVNDLAADLYEDQLIEAWRSGIGALPHLPCS